MIQRVVNDVLSKEVALDISHSLNHSLNRWILSQRKWQPEGTDLDKSAGYVQTNSTNVTWISNNELHITTPRAVVYTIKFVSAVFWAMLVAYMTLP